MTHFNYFYERFFVGISVPVSAVIYCSSYSYLVFHALILIFRSFRSFSPSHTHTVTLRAARIPEGKIKSNVAIYASFVF